MDKLFSLSNFQRCMREVRSLDEAKPALGNCLSILAIHVFAFTYYLHHPSKSNALKYDFAANFLEAWHQHYIEQGYSKIDSTLSNSRNTNLPIIWTLEQQLAEANSKLERQMRQDSIDFGVERGISIPIHGPDGDFAELVVQQRFGESCLANSQELQYTLLSIAHIFYDRIRQLVLKEIEQDDSFGLSRRELQCLTLTAQEKSVADIAKTLSITERTVNFHIQRANKKLGTCNKYQSIQKAHEKGILTTCHK